MMRPLAFTAAALAAGFAWSQAASPEAKGPDMHAQMQGMHARMPGGMDHAAHMAAMQSQRQADVAARGPEVMPFDLAATLHVFTKTATGGVQKVVARPQADAGQVRLVREHLKDIEARFRRGDFSGPSHIHGSDMPGLAELSAAAPGRLRIAYRDVPRGAELVFASEDAKLVAALHRWFDAQVADHGKDAMAAHAQ